MRPRFDLAVATALSASVFCLAACASSAEPAPPVGEAVASGDVGFADCGETSITVDRRTDYQSALADFLDEARLSGCPYGRVQVANAPEPSWGKSRAYVRSRDVVRDYARAFALPWELQREFSDPRLSTYHLRVTLLAPNDVDRARAQAVADEVRTAATRAGVAIPAASADVPLERTLALQTLGRPQGLFSAALAEVCYGAGVADRSPHDVAAEKGYEPSGWVGGRYGTGSAEEDQGWLVAAGKRVYLITRPDTDVCAVNARDGDPMTLASYAMGALDHVSATPYTGVCPRFYTCRGLEDGRIALLGLRLAGEDVPERYRASRGENVGAARALAGVVAPAELAEIVAQVGAEAP
jgi:hypothetical protein